jgi:phenylacetate-CoA ligase
MKLPAVPAPQKKTHANRVIHQLLLQMESSQWWSAARLQRHQLKQLRQLLGWARQYSPYYRRLLQDIDLSRFELADLQSLPLLSRDQLRRQRQQLRCTQYPDAHGAADEMMTSGSTGSPVVVDTTAQVAALWSAISLRDHLWHGRDASLRNASLRWRVENIGMAPEGLEFPGWGAPFSDFYRTGPGFFLNSSSDVRDQLDWLQRVDPHYLISHPSNLRALLQEISKRGVELPRLQQLRTVGEALDDDLLQLANEVLGLPLLDCYSCQEVGYIALQCPAHSHYHVQAEQLIVEVLDEDDRPCGPGQSGRIVLTSLSNFYLPLVRYDIGDYGELTGACDCGRGLPVLRRIQGRVRNMLSLPDGSKRWPNLGFREIMAIADIEQFQLQQHALAHIELKLVVGAQLDVGQEQAIRDILARYLRFPGEIELSYHSSLPRSASGKFEDFISLLD